MSLDWMEVADEFNLEQKEPPGQRQARYERSTHTFVTQISYSRKLCYCVQVSFILSKTTAVV